MTMVIKKKVIFTMQQLLENHKEKEARPISMNLLPENHLKDEARPISVNLLPKNPLKKVA